MKFVLMTLYTATIVTGFLALQGCVPLVTGIKEYKSGDTTISFITGFDTSASLNGIDTVDNQRGIRPGVSK
jgi:hypothetical protein